MFCRWSVITFLILSLSVYFSSSNLSVIIETMKNIDWGLFSVSVGSLFIYLVFPEHNLSVMPQSLCRVLSFSPTD